MKIGKENVNVNSDNNTGGGSGGNTTNIRNTSVSGISGNIGRDLIIGDTNYNISLNDPFEKDILAGLSGNNSGANSGATYDKLSKEEQEKIQEKLQKAMNAKKESYLREMPGLLQAMMDKEESKNPGKQQDISKALDK